MDGEWAYGDVTSGRERGDLVHEETNPGDERGLDDSLKNSAVLAASRGREAGLPALARNIADGKKMSHAVQRAIRTKWTYKTFPKIEAVKSVFTANMNHPQAMVMFKVTSRRVFS